MGDYQPVYSDAAIQTCLTMKVLFGMALRQTTGFVESLLHLIDLDWAVPNFSTLSRRRKTLKVNIPYRGSAGPLHRLIDIEPVSATGSSEPARGDQGRGRRRVERPQAWRHEAPRLAQDPHPLPGRRMEHSPRGGIDEKTLEIRAAELTTSDVGDVEPVNATGSSEPARDAAGTSRPDTVRSGDRQRHRRWRLRHAQVPRRHPLPGNGLPANRERGRPRRCRDHPAPQERQTLEGRQPRSDRAQRGLARIETVGSDDLATMERLSPPKSRRDQDALRETAGPTPEREGLRPSGRRVPNPCGRPERLHCARHAHHRGRGISLSGERGTPAI